MPAQPQRRQSGYQYTGRHSGRPAQTGSSACQTSPRQSVSRRVQTSSFNTYPQSPWPRASLRASDQTCVPESQTRPYQSLETADLQYGSLRVNPSNTGTLRPVTDRCAPAPEAPFSQTQYRQLRPHAAQQSDNPRIHSVTPSSQPCTQTTDRDLHRCSTKNRYVPPPQRGRR